jgi:ATP-binding cassette subfamily B protein
MWNRQREAEQARELLARAGDNEAQPNRNPPVLEEAEAETEQAAADADAQIAAMRAAE